MQQSPEGHGSLRAFFLVKFLSLEAKTSGLFSLLKFVRNLLGFCLN